MDKSNALGASVNWGRIGRNCTPRKVLRAFLPDGLWRLLAESTNSYIVAQRSMGNDKSIYHHNLSSADELKNIFLARMDIIAKGKPTIDLAYEKVSLSSRPGLMWSPLPSDIIHC